MAQNPFESKRIFCLGEYISVENLNITYIINFLIRLDLRQFYSDLGGGGNP